MVSRDVPYPSAPCPECGGIWNMRKKNGVYRHVPLKHPKQDGTLCEARSIKADGAP